MQIVRKKHTVDTAVAMPRSTKRPRVIHTDTAALAKFNKVRTYE